MIIVRNSNLKAQIELTWTELNLRKVLKVSTAQFQIQLPWKRLCLDDQEDRFHHSDYPFPRLTSEH